MFVSPVRLMVTLLVSPASRNMSIEDVTTEIRRGRGSRRDFVITADVVTAEKMDQHHLDSLVADVSLRSTFREGSYLDFIQNNVVFCYL